MEVLKKENIDPIYLENAMQVYVFDYGGETIAQYFRGYGKALELINKTVGKDDNGTIAYPYMLIKPNETNDYERLEQVYNHELFHHYQAHILCGTYNCDKFNSGIISEATANWASSLASVKTNNKGFLNEWASVARNQSNKLLGKYIENRGETNAGYAMYTFLNAYSTNVQDGTNKIINSIYQDNPLGYLEKNSNTNEMSATQEYLAIQNINQNYNNKNLLASPDIKDNQITIEGNINNSFNKKDVNINKQGIAYYSISDKTINIKLVKNNPKIGTIILASNTSNTSNSFTIVDKANTNEYIFDHSKYSNYSKVYLVVYNISLTSKSSYSITINKQPQNTKTSNSTSNSSYISLYDCDAQFNEDIIKQIATYYYDQNEHVNRYVVSTYFNKSSYPEDYYEGYLENKNYTNVRMKDNLVIAEYTPEAMAKNFSDLTKKTVISNHEMGCSLTCSDSDCSWEHNKDLVANFNPDTIK